MRYEPLRDRKYGDISDENGLYYLRDAVGDEQEGLFSCFVVRNGCKISRATNYIGALLGKRAILFPFLRSLTRLRAHPGQSWTVA